ncbi:MAG: insulinase family protein [Desulfobacteraceae bacterium]|nr:MAG: insulinase family protein [Desulfobacteraceae bacterium]
MTQKILGIILLLALSQILWAHFAFSAEIVRKTTLSNGLTLVVAERNQLPTIHLQVLVRAGSSVDTADQLGLANLTAELLLQGTATRDATQISRRIESVGGSLTSAADLDFTSLHLAVLKKDLPLGMELLADILQNPQFAEPEVARKIVEMKARLKRMEEEPRQIAQLAFAKGLFRDHPYAHPVEGSVATLDKLTRVDIQRFFQSYYRPNNALITIVGQVTLEEATGFLEKGLGGWQASPIQKPPLAPPQGLARPEVVKIDRSSSQANILWGHLGVNRGNPDYYTLLVMNYILGGGGFVSRLMDQIRDNLGLTYGIYSHFEAREFPGAFQIVLETKNQNTNQAVAEIRKEIKEFLEKGVTATELAEAKAYLTGSFPLRMDTNAKMVKLLSAIEFYGLGLDYPEKYPQLINQVTEEEILRAARQYLQPEKFLLVVVGDQKEIQLKDSF